MGLFGGGEIEKLESAGQIDRLIEIHLGSQNPNDVERAGKALMRLGDDAVMDLVEAIEPTRDVAAEAVERGRDLLREMGEAAVAPLMDVIMVCSDGARVFAAETLGLMGARRAVGHIEWWMAVVHGRFGRHPSQLAGPYTIAGAAAYYTLSARAAHRCGSESGLRSLVEAMAVHADNREFCGHLAPALVELSGSQPSDPTDARAWREWWEERGHRLGEAGPAGTLPADHHSALMRMNLLGVIEMLEPIAVDAKAGGTVLYEMPVGDGPPRRVRVWNIGVDDAGRVDIAIDANVAAFDGRLPERISRGLLDFNMGLSVGAVIATRGEEQNMLLLREVVPLDDLESGEYVAAVRSVAATAASLARQLT
jgi:hypothetical protein